MKRLHVNEKYCMGCGLCQVHCLTQHSESKGIIKAYKKEKPKPILRIFEEKKSPYWIALQYRHCEDNDACMTGATHRDSETGPYCGTKTSVWGAGHASWSVPWGP